MAVQNDQLHTVSNNCTKSSQPFQSSCVKEIMDAEKESDSHHNHIPLLHCSRAKIFKNSLRLVSRLQIYDLKQQESLRTPSCANTDKI